MTSSLATNHSCVIVHRGIGGVPQGWPDQPSSLGRAIQGPSVPLSVECGASALKVHRILVLHLGMEMQS